MMDALWKAGRNGWSHCTRGVLGDDQYLGSRPVAADVSDSALSSRRCCSAKVTSRIALATATPMAMIAPMNDWRLTVVPVSQSINTTPATTAGVVEMTTNASFTDWKLAVSSSRITTMDIPR